MLGNLGTTEIIIIIAVLIAFFGRKKTGEIARDAGAASKELKKVRKEALEAFEELQKPVDESAPTQEPEVKTPPVVKEGSTVKGGEEIA